MPSTIGSNYTIIKDNIKWKFKNKNIFSKNRANNKSLLHAFFFLGIYSDYLQYNFEKKCYI